MKNYASFCYFNLSVEIFSQTVIYFKISDIKRVTKLNYKRSYLLFFTFSNKIIANSIKFFNNINVE